MVALGGMTPSWIGNGRPIGPSGKRKPCNGNRRSEPDVKQRRLKRRLVVKLRRRPSKKPRKQPKHT